MTPLLQNVADIITEAAGWKKALPDSDGVYRFFLEGGLEFDLLTPENKTGILRADLGNAPSGDAQDDTELRRLARLAAGSLRKRRSIFSIAGSRMELYRTFRITGTAPQEIITETRDFLNDLAWWKRQISGNAGQEKLSPFSFGSGSWFSEGAAF